MIRALVVDDEAPARQLLTQLLERHPEVAVVGQAASGWQALEQVEKLAPDVVFLDVQMPELDGLETARRLAVLPLPPRLVFVTAYDEYALPAFEVAALDYLLKPVDPARLAQTLARLQSGSLQKLLSALKTPEPLARLALVDEDGVRHVVDTTEIVYVFCEDEKTYVRARGRLLRYMETLSGLETRLGSQQFMRVHRSYLVNLGRVLRVEPWGAGTFNLELEGSDRSVPLSRQCAPLFKERVGWI